MTDAKKKLVTLYTGCSIAVAIVCIGSLVGAHSIVSSMKSNSMTILLDTRKQAIAKGELAKSAYASQLDKLKQSVEQNVDTIDSPVDGQNDHTQHGNSSNTTPEDEMIGDNQYIVVNKDGNMVYLIQQGDTLSEISSIVCYSVDELAEYNHIKNVNLIYAGSALRIPEKNATE